MKTSSSLLAYCTCGQRFVVSGNPFGPSSCSRGCEVRAERAVAAAIARRRAAGRKLALRLEAANRESRRLGFTPLALQVPAAPTADVQTSIDLRLAQREEMIRLRNEGDKNRERKLRGF